MSKAKVWVKVKEFSGTPTMDNLKLVEEELPELPELKDGGIIIVHKFQCQNGWNSNLKILQIHKKYFWYICDHLC